MYWLFSALLLLDALRLRKRARALAPLAPPVDGGGEPPDVRVFCAPGVTLTPDQVASAAAHLQRTGLRGLDLWPDALGAAPLFGLFARFDPDAARTDPLAAVVGPGHAVVLRAELADRMGDIAPPDSVAAVQRLVNRARDYATADFDAAVLPGLTTLGDRAADRRETLTDAHRGKIAGLVILQLVLLAIVAGAVGQGASGLLFLALFHLQVPLVLLGSPFRPSGWAVYALLRGPWEAVRWLALVFGRWPDRSAAIDAARPAWAAAWADGNTGFVSPPHTACPSCESTDLRRWITVPDLLQGKPGKFTMRRCGACGLVFQDPALTDAGLSFYYRDFYDGPWGGAEDAFRVMTEDYRNRARAIAQRAAPRRWLDVGTGQGHFPVVARQILPDCAFDGLDWSEAVDEAARRGWIDRSYRTAFVELPGQTADRWDAVSMSHYLEHVREPWREVATAAAVLNDGGHLLIELPSPESPVGWLLGWAWFPWFQPQHLHMPPVAVLRGWLDRAGMDVVLVDRVSPHHPVDFLFATGLLLRRIAPDTNLPWRPASRAARIWRFLVESNAWPLFLAAGLADHLLLPVLRARGWTNAYLVVAKKRQAVVA